ncbi:MAG: SAM-dependent chlorinase/fluorinase [Kofleriaceae bacterium]|nr:SAM-dependent chlorinase/fluorinase [Kofleriaceae bacterium]MCL4226021.1 SAM-dependent chlorinase/fluorinase [Myxococcales bacterium]
MPVLVTLTTDFGTADGYVGAMKGVIARLTPEAVVVDVAHDVPRHDIAHAAWVLATSAPEFPAGTIHVAVVDPGVGGARAPVVIAAGGHLYVGPDNGLFAYVAERPDLVHAITSTAFRMPSPSDTFHGRDVFAPAAAALARGLPPGAAGPATCLAGALPWATRATARGVVVHVDVYGNLITNLPGPARPLRAGGRDIAPVRTYEELPAGGLGCYTGSAGTVEIAVREGSAAAHLRLGRGAEVAFA